MTIVIFIISLLLYIAVVTLLVKKYNKKINIAIGEKNYYEAKLAILQRQLNERVRVCCNLMFSASDLEYMPDEFIDRQAEFALNELTRAMAKTYEKSVTKRLKDLLTDLKYRSTLACGSPYEKILQVSAPVFRIDLLGLSVRNLDELHHGG